MERTITVGENELIQTEIKTEILLFSCRVESPATVKDSAIQWLSPEADPRPPGASGGRAVVHMTTQCPYYVYCT